MAQRKNQYTADIVLYPISPATLEKMGIEISEKDTPIRGIMLSKSLVERGYHRWARDKESPHPYQHELVEPEITSLLGKIAGQKTRADNAEDHRAKAEKNVAKAEKDRDKWINKTHEHVETIEQLQQEVREAQGLQSAAEQEKQVSDTIIKAREKDNADLANSIDDLQKTVDRYEARYGKLGRQWSAWQRFGAWLFGI